MDLPRNRMPHRRVAAVALGTRGLGEVQLVVPRENTKTNVDWQVYLSEFALRQFKDLHALTGDSGGVHQATPRSRLDLGIRRCLVPFIFRALLSRIDALSL